MGSRRGAVLKSNRVRLTDHLTRHHLLTLSIHLYLPENMTFRFSLIIAGTSLPYCHHSLRLSYDQPELRIYIPVANVIPLVSRMDLPLTPEIEKLKSSCHFEGNCAYLLLIHSSGGVLSFLRSGENISFRGATISTQVCI